MDGQYYTRVATLGAGKSFGDVALQRKCLTNANIKTERETHFAYMTRDAYINQIKKISEEVEQDRVTFLKNLPLFLPITRMTVLSFYLGMEKLECHRGQEVFKESDPASHIYIVFRGLFEMEKKSRDKTML